MKDKIIYFASNVLTFLLLLWFAKGQSGGDIFLIVFYSILTFIQFFYCIIFTAKKENIIGILLGIVFSFCLFKIVDNQQSKQEIKVINEDLKVN